MQASKVNYTDSTLQHIISGSERMNTFSIVCVGVIFVAEVEMLCHGQEGAHR